MRNFQRDPNCRDCHGTGTQEYMHRGQLSGCECLCKNPEDWVIERQELYITIHTALAKNGHDTILNIVADFYSSLQERTPEEKDANALAFTLRELARKYKPR
jgi:hypothetical protein